MRSSRTDAAGLFQAQHRTTPCQRALNIRCAGSDDTLLSEYHRNTWQSQLPADLRRRSARRPALHDQHLRRAAGRRAITPAAPYPIRPAVGATSTVRRGGTRCCPARTRAMLQPEARASSRRRRARSSRH
eukprot:6216287-Pyramimonas_sp.AAC.1